ncbi:MAG TPA: heme ABC transporter ATP-binding protein [Desulfobulbaceae bacterium]|nr:heme ABC transporter ATP-binding protein [Desulfobulbaceae bacterium]
MNCLMVNSITVRAGTRTILNRLECTVRAGDFLVIIGPNGAGKTTLLKALCGLVSVSSGEIKVMGRPLADYSRRQLAATLALVPQNLNLEFAFTVEETVRMGRAPHLGLLERERQADQAIARQAMAFTDVAHLADRCLNQLSGGERQRTMIARAICQQPKIMLLDEPTASLDPAHQLRIMELMQRLRREEMMTVVMVSHDLNLAALFASSILLLKEGAALCAGPPAEILTQDNLRRAYGCAMHVDVHPCTGTPRVSLVPGGAS